MKAARPLAISALVVLGAVAALGLSEIGLRIFEATSFGAPKGTVASPKALHQQTANGKRITPNLDIVIHRHPTSLRDIRVRTNSLGLRGPEVPPHVPGELRILVLGDSITFGDYVDEDETYPVALERRLQAALPARTVRVINAGGPNVGTQDEAALLGELAPAIRPDLVLVGFYLNDGLGQVPYPDRIEIPSWLKWSRLAQRVTTEWARDRQRARVGTHYVWVYDFVSRKWVTDQIAYDHLVAMAKDDWGAAWREESWAPVEEGLRQMLALGQRYGFRLAVAAFPVSIQVESLHGDDYPQRRIRALAGSLQIAFADMLPALRAAHQPHLFYDQCHLTPAGNAIVADQLVGLVEHAVGAPVSATASP